eukprot:7134312-Alexandrium_andersonii.AAC.1
MPLKRKCSWPRGAASLHDAFGRLAGSALQRAEAFVPLPVVQNADVESFPHHRHRHHHQHP